MNENIKIYIKAIIKVTDAGQETGVGLTHLYKHLLVINICQMFVTQWRREQNVALW